MLETGASASPENVGTCYTNEDYEADDVMTSSGPTSSYPSESVFAWRNRFCRVCLKKSESYLLPLVAQMEQITVMEMLLMVTGLELEANPLFPTKICTNCMTKLDFAYNVRQEFLNSSELLLKLAVEDRLVGYYARFMEGEDGRGGTYTDGLLKDSRNVLEAKMDFDVEVGYCEKKEVVEVEDLTTEEKIEVVEFEQMECLEDELEEQTPEDEKERSTVAIPRYSTINAHLQQKTPDHRNQGESTEVKTEQFVYSWKELIKPKRSKKERPKTALSGIDRKAKADAELLARFPPTTCYICDTAHQTLQERDEHLNVHIGMVPHRCETCSTDNEPVISKSVVTLNRHRLMHRMPYKCTMCFRRFISSGSQYTHIWSMHMATDSEGMTCDYCGKRFTQKRSFQAHVRRHRYKANGKYRCDVCEETCGSSLLLARHKRKHTGEKNFSCPYCSKRFSRACNLLTHKRIHTNEKCHRCEHCGRSFRDSVTLRKHQERFHMGRAQAVRSDRNAFIVTQDGRKMFQCKYDGCKYETYSSASISRHKARHLKRYACGDCGKRFAEPNLVRRHQASMHSGGKMMQEGHRKVGTHVSDHPVQLDEYAEEVGQPEPEYEIKVVDDIGKKYKCESTEV